MTIRLMTFLTMKLSLEIEEDRDATESRLLSFLGCLLFYPLATHPRSSKSVLSNSTSREALLAQSVEATTLDFDSGHDLRFLGLSPELAQSLFQDSLSPFASAPPPAHLCNSL